MPGWIRPTVLRKRGRDIALVNPRVVSKAEAEALVVPRSRLLYRAFPYNEAALLLTNRGSTD